MINITVDSYFEYFTTILAWIMNNAMWDIIVQTGLVFLPFLGYVISSPPKTSARSVRTRS